MSSIMFQKLRFFLNQGKYGYPENIENKTNKFSGLFNKKENVHVHLRVEKVNN